MIHYYYGDGKGKTTAAMGLAVRALGRGKRVFIVQFLKDTPTGEVLLLERMEGVTVCRGKAGKGFTFSMTKDELRKTAHIHNENLAKGIAAAKEAACDMLVLDEVGDAYAQDLLDKNALLDFLQEKRKVTEIVMTGHVSISEIVSLADYITYMRKEKHPFDEAVEARVGVEY